MRNGRCYLADVLDPPIYDSASLSLPTPAARDYRDVSLKKAYAASWMRHQPSLATEVLLAEIGGLRIAQIYEWVMGFPYGYLVSVFDSQEMPSNRKSRKKSGG